MEFQILLGVIVALIALVGVLIAQVMKKPKNPTFTLQCQSHPDMSAKLINMEKEINDIKIHNNGMDNKVDGISRHVSALEIKLDGINTNQLTMIRKLDDIGKEVTKGSKS